MTATDELRRLLDERGVEWWDDEGASTFWTCWNGTLDGKEWGIWEAIDYEGDLLHVSFSCYEDHITPEQTIAVSLGLGTCKVAYCEDAYGTDGWSCSECGEWFAATFRHTGRNNLVEPHYCPNCGKRVTP